MHSHDQPSIYEYTHTHTFSPAASSSSSHSWAEAIISNGPLGPLQAQIAHLQHSEINDPHTLLLHTHATAFTVNFGCEGKATFFFTKSVTPRQHVVLLFEDICSTNTLRGLGEIGTISRTQDGVSANSCGLSLVSFLATLPSSNRCHYMLQTLHSLSCRMRWC